MRTAPAPLRLAVVSAALAALGGTAVYAAGPPAPSTPATPSARCAGGSLPEATQGRAPLSDVASGRYAKGYTCNVAEISHSGRTGGYRVERYVDAQGNECAFYDSTLLYPTSVPDQVPDDGPGTYVLDMKDPAKPVVTSVLRTAAFSSPHESMRLNQERGLLAAVFAYPTTQPGQVDVYDVSQDCRTPQLLSSTPFGLLGHEGGFAPDGNTYYVGSLYFNTLTAIDLTNPRAPKPIWTTTDYEPHGVSLSDDGKTLYMAEAALSSGGFDGLTVLDVTQVQERALNPSVPVVSRLSWDSVSTPQNATPFVKDGKKYLMEIDEFGSGAKIGAARILDINDVKKPFVVSDIRLEVNRAEAQGPDLEADPGNDQAFQGYQGHYCSLPSRDNPQILACTFIMSGLRVFDISDLSKPREIAYHNRPILPGTASNPRRAGSFAMAAPAYDEKTGDIWYSDGNSGFYVVRLTGPAKRKAFADSIVLPGN